MKKLTKTQLNKYNLFLAEESNGNLSYFTSGEELELLITSDEIVVIEADCASTMFDNRKEALEYIEDYMKHNIFI